MSQAQKDVGLEYLRERHRLSPRRVRLLACACARLAWRQLRAEASRRAVMLAERVADGQAARERLASAQVEAQAAVGRHGGEAAVAAATVAALTASIYPNEAALADRLGPALAGLANANDHLGPDHSALIAALHDLLAPRWYADSILPPAWRTPDVMALAGRAYEGRDRDAVPILGDALEDAGCDWPEMLTHCREGGRHFRGCWALDLLLGKE